MPCYTPTDADIKGSAITEKIVYRTDTTETDFLEGLLCACLTKLEEMKVDLCELENEAKIEGLINWWESHKDTDKKRLKAIFQSLSDQEKERFKEMLNA